MLFHAVDGFDPFVTDTTLMNYTGTPSLNGL